MEWLQGCSCMWICFVFMFPTHLQHRRNPNLYMIRYVWIYSAFLDWYYCCSQCTNICYWMMLECLEGCQSRTFHVVPRWRPPLMYLRNVQYGIPYTEHMDVTWHKLARTSLQQEDTRCQVKTTMYQVPEEATQQERTAHSPAPQKRGWLWTDIFIRPQIGIHSCQASRNDNVMASQSGVWGKLGQEWTIV